MKKKYDIFISYRREGGINSAIALHSTLLSMNYRAFLDVNNLQSGKFDEALLDVIEHCKDFLLVLSPGALDRCVNEDDWVRREVTYAMERGKNIIPIICDGGDMTERFTAAVPEALGELRSYQVLQADVVQLQAMNALLRTNLLSRPAATAGKRATWLAAAAVIVLLAVLGGIKLKDYLSVFPRTQAEMNLLDETVSVQALNMTAFDLAQKEYIEALEDALDYVSGSGKLTRTALSDSLNRHAELINLQIEAIRPMDDGLMVRVEKSPLPAADLAAQEGYLKDTMNTMAANLTYLEFFLIDDEYTMEHSKADWIEIYLKMAELDGDMAMMALNESMLPVAPSALATLKTKYMSRLTTIGRSYIWRERPEDLASFQENLLLRYEEQTDDLEQLVDRSEAMYEHEKELAELRIAAKENKLAQRRAELEQLKQELAAAKAEAYEKFRPLASDDPGILWSKALRFLRISMPDAAIECFTMYSVSDGTADTRICGETAARFVEYMGETGVKGGVMVTMYEPDKPQQPDVRIGDIIYAVNGKEIMHFTDYANAKNGNEASELGVLRFTNAGYELVKVKLDPSCGLLGMMDLSEEVAQ